MRSQRPPLTVTTFAGILGRHLCDVEFRLELQGRGLCRLGSDDGCSPDCTAIVWSGDHTLPCITGENSWATQSSSQRSCARFLSHRVLFERISTVPDLRAAWLLLLYCAGTRANLRMGPWDVASAVCWNPHPPPHGKCEPAFLHWRVGLAEGFPHQFSPLLGQLGLTVSTQCRPDIGAHISAEVGLVGMWKLL